MSNINDFVIENGVLTEYCGDGGDVVIPEGVTRIGDSAFECCEELTSVIIPEGVTSIGDIAFADCTSLTSITIPEGVTSIGESAFFRCTSLTSVAIPDGVTKIGGSAFNECTSLTSITIPEGVTSIGDRAFYGCEGLKDCNGFVIVRNILYGYFGKDKDVTIPEGVTSICDSAFSRCTSLTSVAIPEGVTSIGKYAFFDCTSLTSITIPEGVTNIGDGAFSICTSLTSITIPEGVTSIGDSAFFRCTSLTSVAIPEGVTSVGNSAFYECNNLTSVIIPDGVTNIGDIAFSNVNNIHLEMNIECPAWKIGRWKFYGRADSIIDGNGATISFRDDFGEIVAKVILAMEGETGLKIDDAILSIKQEKHKFDFDGYDSNWKNLAKTINKIRIAILRLQYPYELSEEMESAYEVFLSRRGLNAGKFFIDYNDVESLKWMLEKKFVTKSAFPKLIDYASEKGKIEFTAVLLAAQNEQR